VDPSHFLNFTLFVGLVFATCIFALASTFVASTFAASTFVASTFVASTFTIAIIIALVNFAVVATPLYATANVKRNLVFRGKSLVQLGRCGCHERSVFRAKSLGAHFLQVESTQGGGAHKIDEANLLRGEVVPMFLERAAERFVKRHGGVRVAWCCVAVCRRGSNRRTGAELRVGLQSAVITLEKKKTLTTNLETVIAQLRGKYLSQFSADKRRNVSANVSQNRRNALVQIRSISIPRVMLNVFLAKFPQLFLIRVEL
jgi:hypothetical protein